jgi:hypothetical protein
VNFVMWFGTLVTETSFRRWLMLSLPEALHQHDVAFDPLHQRAQNPFTVRRDGETVETGFLWELPGRLDLARAEPEKPDSRAGREADPVLQKFPTVKPEGRT